MRRSVALPMPNDPPASDPAPTPAAPPSEAPGPTPTDARQGVELHRMRYVLAVSLAAAVAVLAVVYLAA
ncbi:MAG: hypothetical protein IT561_16130 [Alphaproteobacteria bacterium]|nr:hypothetical protein [Alphaproteobacteria bacterium]